MSNSLVAVHPELIVEWSDRNLPLTPDSVTFGSNKKVWWKGTCGHEWQTSIKARSNGEKCPICSGARVVTGINDLSTLKPELASEWSEKNEIKPTEVSIGSHKKVLWKCKLGHESKLVDAIDVAKATKQIVMQNIVIALGIKSVFLILGALGIAGMWEAVFGDVGVTIIAVLNAMRILKK